MTSRMVEMSDRRLCSMPGCERVARTRGRCDPHKYRSFAERFWARVDRSGPCWLWLGPTDKHGYGHAQAYKRLSGRPYQFAYWLTHGAVPEGLEIDHICRNRACVRPSHLRAVTHLENGIAQIADTTHCVNGHEYTDDNTRWWRRANGRMARCCVTCKRAYQAELRARKRRGEFVRRAA